MDSSIVPYLFLVTFIIALAYAWLQYRAAKRAQQEHHRSAEAEVHHEPMETHDPARATSTARDGRRE